ncbi:hypothetical protein NDA03_07885 [Trichocoleus sp. Lan]|uniref:hypothetical protein n=1 Tax=Trichocoleus sp. Lan TaxID=2933927 RepID=UPI0032987A50
MVTAAVVPANFSLEDFMRNPPEKAFTGKATQSQVDREAKFIQMFLVVPTSQGIVQM